MILRPCLGSCQPQITEESLYTFEGKIFRKIFGPICVNEEYRRKINHELYELYDDVELAIFFFIVSLIPTGTWVIKTSHTS